MVPIGVMHISCHYKNTIEGTGKKRTNEQTLGVNSSAEREFCNTLCMCRLTLVWILQSYWNADSSSLTVAGPSWHADSPHCYGVRSRLPLSVSRRQLPTSSSFFQLSSRVPLPLPDPARIQVQNTLSGFAPKQTKESSAWRATYIVLHLYWWTVLFQTIPFRISIVYF